MFKECKHSECAVCKQLEDRKVFKQTLETLHPEVFLCPHAAYEVVTNNNGGSFILPSLEFVKFSRGRYWVSDVYTALPILLRKSNLKVVCTKDGECNCEPFTQVAFNESDKKDDQ